MVSSRVASSACTSRSLDTVIARSAATDSFAGRARVVPSHNRTLRSCDSSRARASRAMREHAGAGARHVADAPPGAVLRIRKERPMHFRLRSTASRWIAPLFALALVVERAEAQLTCGNPAVNGPPYNQEIWVDPVLGNDATAVVNNPFFPARTIQFAINFLPGPLGPG